MKKSYINFAVIFMTILLISCQSTVNMEQEKESILSVLEREGQAFAEMDKDKLYGLFIHDELNTRFTVSTQAYQVFEGWESIKSLYDSYWENWTREGNPRNLKENAIIRVSGHAAWALCDNIWEWETPSGIRRNTNIQTTILEKINNEWKINFMSFIPKPPDDQTLAEIEKIRNEQLKSLNQDNVEGILANHTEETVYLVPNDRAYKGLDEIRQFQEARIAQMASYDGKGEAKILETKIFPGIAYDRFELKIELTSKSDQSPLAINYQGIWIYHQQEDGSWKLARAIWTDYNP